MKAAVTLQVCAGDICNEACLSYLLLWRSYTELLPTLSQAMHSVQAQDGQVKEGQAGGLWGRCEVGPPWEVGPSQ